MKTFSLLFFLKPPAASSLNSKPLMQKLNEILQTYSLFFIQVLVPIAWIYSSSCDLEPKLYEDKECFYSSSCTQEEKLFEEPFPGPKRIQNNHEAMKNKKQAINIPFNIYRKIEKQSYTFIIADIWQELNMYKSLQALCHIIFTSLWGRYYYHRASPCECDIPKIT